MRAARLTWVLLGALASACTAHDEKREAEATASFAEEKARAELGRKLFFDPQLSADGTVSCQSCHDPAKAFADGQSLPLGVTGKTLPRNSQGLHYVGLFQRFTWANPVFSSLEQQILVPLFGDNPPELLLGAVWPSLQQTLTADPTYQELWLKSFPTWSSEQAIKPVHLTTALASFLKTLSPFDSPYDRWLAGEEGALEPSAIEGLSLFNGKALCSSCHSGPLFNGQGKNQDQWGPHRFERNGLSGIHRPPEHPLGLSEFTGNEEDWDVFRVPSLRNVSLTAPYLHDGRVQKLSELLQLYNEGKQLNLSKEELLNLEAFLQTLTDRTQFGPIPSRPQMTEARL